jgi:hypothetical protein
MNRTNWIRRYGWFVVVNPITVLYGVAWIMHLMNQTQHWPWWLYPTGVIVLVGGLAAGLGALALFLFLLEDDLS